MSRYIVTNPAIMSGVPIIRGTRVPISRVVFLLSEGHTLDSIHEMYPHLERNLLHGAINELIRDIDAKEYEAASV